MRVVSWVPACATVAPDMGRPAPGDWERNYSDVNGHRDGCGVSFSVHPVVRPRPIGGGGANDRAESAHGGVFA